jgi:hypothetical protein
VAEIRKLQKRSHKWPQLLFRSAVHPLLFVLLPA